MDLRIFMAIRNFFWNFYDATKATKRRQATINMVIPTIDFLLEIFEERVEKYQYDEYISIGINLGWKKMTKYYQKANQAPAYIAAIVLDPTKKLTYFQDWEPEW